jgi:hypothetical protein
MLPGVSRALFAFTLLVGAAGSDVARAASCDNGCTSQLSACRLAAKATEVACRGECPSKAADAEGARACRRECVSEYRLARNGCLDERRQTCPRLCDDSSICIDACGEQLRRCAAALGKRGQPCRRLCAHDPALLACRAACLQAWVGGCRGGVQACVPGCAGTTTTTSTTTTTIVCLSNPAGGPDTLDLTVSGNGTDLDVGWTGVDHNFPLVPNATLRMCLATCGPGGTPPCDMLGLVGRREPNGATFGTPLPLLAANVPICIVNEWNPTIPPTGTVNPLTGDASLQIDLTSKVHLTTATQVCPRCNNGRCDSGPNQGKACTVEATLAVTQSLGANKLYNLSQDCPPDPGALAAPLDIRLPATTGTAMLAGPTPCTSQPGQPMGTPVMDDDCGGTGCGAGNCTGSACASMTTDPSTGAPICMDSKGGLSQNCCNGDTTKQCFPTAGEAIVRMGRPFPPSPPFPDQTYPKTGNGVLAAVFCVPATGANSIDVTAGVPGPGALVAPISATWHRAPGG